MINENPLVSIIIPAYNIEAYIADCVESVLGQTYRNLEIIIVNDGSTDGTAVCCNDLAVSDSRITVIHQKNAGVVSAREAGISASHGQFLSFIDGDDWVEPDMIEEMVGEIGNADMISAGVYREYFPGNIIKRMDRFGPGIYRGKQDLSYIYEKMIYDQELKVLQPMTPWIFNKLYIGSKVKKIHKNIDEDIAFAEDSIFLYQYMLEECESIVISKKCFYHYRYRIDSAVHAINEHALADINKVYLVLKRLFQEHWKKRELLFQLQNWVMVLTCSAVSERMGFDKRISIPEFLGNMKDVSNRKLILYGAGKAGRDIYRQLVEFGYEILAWVDRGYQHYQEMGLHVKSPDEIRGYDYDMILIAIEDKKTADNIKKILVKKGIPENCIIWNKLMKLY